MIDRNAFNLDLSPSSQWSNELEANGYYNRAQFKIRVRLYCQANYYGSDCSVHCVPQDNNSGHYTCGSNGEKICNTGYTNSAGNCLTRKRYWEFVCDSFIMTSNFQAEPHVQWYNVMVSVL